MLSVAFSYSYAECLYAGCRYAEVIMLIVVILNVMAPLTNLVGEGGKNHFLKPL